MAVPPSLPLHELRQVLLSVSNQRSLESLTEKAVTLILGMREHFVRFAVWLVDRDERGGPRESLHLAASAWKEGRRPRQEWTHADGDFRRVPFTEPLIGAVARSGFQYAFDVEDWPGGRPDWAEAAGIQSFGAKAMVYQERLIGVLGLFSEYMLEENIERGRDFFAIFATHLAAAIVNAEAYEQIQALRARLEDQNSYLEEELLVAAGLGGIVGESEALKDCMRQVQLVAPTDASVLLLGESGTGKELFARAIHDSSPRRDGPMVKVNCAAVPRDLFESEFFGHVKGAFTGAIRERRGRFELADGGTLFLDEIGEIPHELQGKLLRVLQESEFERVGDEQPRRSNVRLVAATNKDLREEVEADRFREDLFYRVSVFPIELPPLRERREDVPALAEHFVQVARKRLGGPPIRLQQHHLAQLAAHDWPGNARELQNVIERAVITARSGRFQLDLPGAADAVVATSGSDAGDEPRVVLTEAEIRDLERRNLEAALEQCEGRVFGERGAAKLLGIHPTTLSSRLRSMERAGAKGAGKPRQAGRKKPRTAPAKAATRKRRRETS